MPAGIKESLDELNDQRQLRNNRLLNVPINNFRSGQNQIDITLASIINTYHESLANFTTKLSVVRNIRKNLISSYPDVVTCDNIGCKECMVL